MKLTQAAAKALLAGTATLFLWSAAPGCGPTAQSYCQKRCDCLKCDEASETLCESSIEDAQQQAEQKSCQSELGDYFSCIDGETQCIDGKLDDDGCEVELEIAKSCGVFFGNACDKYLSDYTAKLSECGIENPDPGSIECTPTLEKQAACLDECLSIIDCQCFVDASAPGCNDKLTQYQNCVVPCVE